MAPLAHSILVTGSNRGIGLELIQQLVKMAEPPELIFATCRTPDGPGGKTLNELASKHSNIHIIQLEVEDQSSVKAAASAVESLLHGKGLNLLINNAGVNSYATLETVEQQEMLSAFNTNVVGPILMVKEFLPLLKKAAGEAAIKEMSCQRAAIINVTSKLASIERGFEVMKGPMYPYRASKAALNMVTVCFALELKEEGILCTLIHPGWVKTDMGTEQAPVTVQKSVQGILNVLANLSSASNGAFLDWEGKRLPW
ncbi:C-signal-like [Vipera latastei]